MKNRLNIEQVIYVLNLCKASPKTMIWLSNSLHFQFSISTHEARKVISFMAANEIIVRHYETRSLELTWRASRSFI